jgi:hypothetical protein
MHRIFVGVLLTLAAILRSAFSPQEEFATIEKGFKQVETEWESGRFGIKPSVDEINTQPTSAGLVRSSVLALQGSCILAGVVVIK